ncbi:EF-P beta-lysylation protein EpmB [Haliea atlantica]|nr:EF-P beta-lysylation protein EpmB [Haliea sp.]|tara:strand:- start:237438 stop:238463 length:1026 start_codon:yes stop_codon:yes gene_type:complete
MADAHLIATTQAPRESWREAMADLISSGEELLASLGLDSEALGLSAEAARTFPLRVPRAFAARMRRGDPNDPLLRQVLAVREETLPAPGFGADPTGEQGDANPRRGVIHKYHGRLLLVVTGSCAIHCRYCFRRHFPYGDNQNSRKEWGEALDYIAADPEVHEVILSGGDPLVAGDRALAELVQSIAAIPHVKRLRVHTRLPVVIPERVTDGLLQALAGTRLPCVVVLHSNHHRELDAAVADSCRQMAAAGITLLNQAVLLRGVNDNLDAQLQLAERLFELGVLPYYLHLLDKVDGASHFDIPEALALELHHAMAARLPGYLLPRLVREVAGAPAKMAVTAG